MLFLEEINNDVNKTLLMLNREKKEGISQKEKEAIDIFKRVLTVIDCGGLSVSDGNTVVSGSNNKLPVPSYIAHGSRILIQIPPTENANQHEFMNWLVHGNKSKVFIDSDEQKRNPLFTRFVSSHSTHLKSINDQEIYIEDKGVLVGALDSLKTFGNTKESSHHFGLNFAFSKNDSKHEVLPDGEHGHMYMHYRAPTKDKPGSLMIGVENSEPGKSNHSLLGTPNKTTHIGGGKWSEMLAKYNVSDNLPDISIPRTLNGMRIDLNSQNFEKLISNAIVFDEKCLSNPPKIPADITNHELINQKIAAKIKEKVVNLKDIFAKPTTLDMLPIVSKKNEITRLR